MGVTINGMASLAISAYSDLPVRRNRSAPSSTICAFTYGEYHGGSNLMPQFIAHGKPYGHETSPDANFFRSGVTYEWTKISAAAVAARRVCSSISGRKEEKSMPRAVDAINNGCM